VKKILSLYLTSEIVPPFLLGLLTFTFILLIFRILRLIELVVTRGVPLLQIGKLFLLILPTFLELTVPMALLLGIFLGLGRLSSDQEMLALKATGISPTQILVPIGIIAMVIALMTLLITTLVRPAANSALKKELYNIAKSRVTTALKEKVFNDDFPGILIYAEEVIPPGNTCQGVLIVDRRNPPRDSIIFGKVAIITSDEESKSLSLRLFDGAVYEREKDRMGFSQTHFNLYDFKLDLEEALIPVRNKERGPKEMSLRRLWSTIHHKEERGLKPTSEMMELHQRFSFAFAPLVFSLLALALVMLPTRSRASRPWGLVLCLFWFLAYYALLSLGKALGERELVPAAFALWLPNLVVGVTAIYTFRKAIDESPLFLQATLEDLPFYLSRRLANHKQRG
jgi:lipopolysaccharide export system permease protein